MDELELACWNALTGGTGRGNRTKTIRQKEALVAGWCLTGLITIDQAQEFAELLGLDGLGFNRKAA